jgi:hypothetical protein
VPAESRENTQDREVTLQNLQRSRADAHCEKCHLPGPEGAARLGFDDARGRLEFIEATAPHGTAGLKEADTRQFVPFA